MLNKEVDDTTIESQRLRFLIRNRDSRNGHSDEE